MRLLLDTHTFIWAVESPERLTQTVQTAMQESANQRLVSMATVWELSIKTGLGKLTLSLPLKQWVTQAATALSATILPITIDDADQQSVLPLHHGDPFDRMLAAQSLVGNLTIVSRDAVFDRYGVSRIW